MPVWLRLVMVMVPPQQASFGQTFFHTWDSKFGPTAAMSNLVVLLQSGELQTLLWMVCSPDSGME